MGLCSQAQGIWFCGQVQRKVGCTGILSETRTGLCYQLHCVLCSPSFVITPTTSHTTSSNQILSISPLNYPHIPMAFSSTLIISCPFLLSTTTDSPRP